MHVYLDTAILLDVCADSDQLERLNRLASKGVRYIFTYVHLLDISGVESVNDVLSITSRLAQLDGAVWRLGGLELGALEVARLKLGSANDGDAILPHPTHPRGISWSGYFLQVQQSPDSEMERLKALRGAIEARQRARALSREASIVASGVKKTKFEKELFKYMEGRSSERELAFAESRRKPEELVAQPESLTDVVASAKLAIDGFGLILLPLVVQRPDLRRDVQGALVEAFADLVGAVQAAEEMLGEEAGKGPAMTQLVSRIQRGLVQFSREVNLLGRPSGAATNAREHEMYTGFELCYRMALDLGLADHCDEDVKRALFRRWLSESTTSCQAGYLLGKARLRIDSRLDVRETVSDYADLEHLSMLPYVDVLFADKRTFELVRTMHDTFPEYLSRMKKNEDFSSWLEEVETALQSTP